MKTIVYLEFHEDDEITVAEVEIDDDGELYQMCGYGEFEEEAIEDLIEVFYEIYDTEDAEELENQLIEAAEEKGVYF